MEEEIISCFIQNQLFKMPEDIEAYLNDECRLMTYSFLEKETGKTKDEIKPVVLELRNEGLIELMPAVDYDGVPNGSGYMLTKKGVDFINATYREQLDNLI